MCQRLKAPNRFRELAVSCARYHGYTHRLYELRAKTLLKLLLGLDAFRRPQRLRRFLLVCEADYRGRQGFHGRAYPQADDLWHLYEVARGVSLGAEASADSGWLRGQAIQRARLRRVSVAMAELADRSGSAAEAVEDTEARDIGADGGAQGAEKEDQQGA